MSHQTNKQHFSSLLALKLLYHDSCWWVRKLEKITSLKHFKNPILTFAIEVKESNRQGKTDFLQGLNRVKFDNLATILDPMGFKWPKLMILYIKAWCQKLPVPKIYKLPPALSLKKETLNWPDPIWTYVYLWYKGFSCSAKFFLVQFF